MEDTQSQQCIGELGREVVISLFRQLTVAADAISLSHPEEAGARMGN